MRIVKTAYFNSGLKVVLRFIAIDSKTRAKSFKDTLYDGLQNLVNMPYRHRRSIYFDKNEIRDFIFKGYTIVYEIDEKKNRIIIMGITKYKENF